MHEPDVPQWTFITVTFNSASTLRQCWRSPIPENVEWIVVDNASADDSAAVARELGAAQVITLDRNMGFGFANNAALGVARGTYVCFLNPDVTVDFDTLDVLQKVLLDEDVLVAPQLTNPDGTLQPNGRGFPTLRNKVANRRGYLHDTYFRLSNSGEVTPVCWVIGAALCGRRDTFRRLGGWDSAFFIYYEDSDICLRAWAAGIPTFVLGSARWEHKWARATTRFALGPWAHELASMTRFYGRYPRLIWKDEWARKRYPDIAAAMTASHVDLLQTDPPAVRRASRS